MEDVRIQNRFSRSLINDAKAGAYYTDISHCKRISNFLKFPENEVCVLEPSIGDASAVKAVVSGANTKIFGVELNTNTYNSVLEDGGVDFLLNADFLRGIKVSHSSFSFCFANPPYGVDERETRLELLFLEKLHPYMKAGGILVYVIPHYVACDEKFLRSYMARFEPISEFRFDDDEFSRFKQVVLFGKRRRSLGYMKEEYETYYKLFQDITYFPYLPNEADFQIEVPPSEEKSIEYFTTINFDEKKALSDLRFSSLSKLAGENLFVKEHQRLNVGNPPVPLKKDLLYLVSISGGGEGRCGSVEDGDLHLQRGKVTVKETTVIRESDSGSYEDVTTSSVTEMTLIDSHGNIIHLEGTAVAAEEGDEDYEN